MKNYRADIDFLSKHVEVTELGKQNGKARVAIIPAWQGRVMTSTAEGDKGFSYGWMNYKLIESGKRTEHINAFGGEERIWLGPEGGPYSIYFAPGKKQEFSNWYVPKELDTEAFDVVEKNDTSIRLTKNFELINASGFRFSLAIEREVRILGASGFQQTFGNSELKSLSLVGYESKNCLINNGLNPWIKDSGALSIWMLSMFTPSPGVTVFIPVKEGPDSLLGPVVKSDYFGKIPPDRLKIDKNIVFFKIDGKFRSKIGINPKRALPMAGSYDADHNTLTLVWCSLPSEPREYVNSQWGEQTDPYQGDVINSYNDGPTEDGTQMGPFYELESSSPAALLAPGEKIQHVQRIFHLEGNREELSDITLQIFGVSLQQIASQFNP